MKSLKFKVELLSDIIINQKAASAGPNKTLDFIPGSNFLGIAASKLYTTLLPEESMYIFHSGKVRFGDAHLGKDGVRSHKVPAAMFYPKLEKASEKLYIRYLIPEDEETRKKQLKQCRNGFYDFSVSPAAPATADTNFAIKSAYDIEKRTSQKSQMFGYESLSKGSIMYFEVEMDGEKYADQITEALVGQKRVGRSRSAQYGLVKISKDNYCEVCSQSITGDGVTVYADSRLIFLDENTGMPTFRPKAGDLGLEGGEIDWEHSQIRTFQYSPWNYQRQCFDTDRCGIEKGSVIVVKGVAECPSVSQYKGYYKNEGFGRIIYNPAFLDGDKTNGRAKIVLAEKPKPKSEEKNVEPIADSDTSLLKFLKARHKEETLEKEILVDVSVWMEKNKKLFKGKAFASQWGTIRSLASKPNSKVALYDQLFMKDTGYLVHGVAEENWSERGRLKALREFAANFDNDNLFRLAMVNLAAEMAKECRKED